MRSRLIAATLAGVAALAFSICPKTTRADGPASPEKKQLVTWASGTVRNAAGEPVPGASVWAVASYTAGIRMGEAAAKATTDAKGRYEIKGEAGLSGFAAALVAHVPGKPPSWAWIAERRNGAPVGPPEPPNLRAPTVDFVLPDRGGSLEVTVVHDKKPAAGVAVGLSLEGIILGSHITYNPNRQERAEVEAVVHPVARTDSAGVARFDALLPGQYRIEAALGGEQSVRTLQQHGPDGGRGTYAIASSVLVRLGQTTAHRISIYTHRNESAVRVCRPNGEPLSRRVMSYGYGRITGVDRFMSQIEGKDSFLELAFEGPGLWRVEFKYREARPWNVDTKFDNPIETTPSRDPPCFAAYGVLAASALLPAGKHSETTQLTARWYERFEPAAPAAPALAGLGSFFLGPESLSWQGASAERLVGRVLLPDGTTSALAARVIYFDPSWRQPIGGMTNARGQIRAAGMVYWGSGTPAGAPDDPRGPTVVAMLPGSYGATVTSAPQPGKPLEIVLPPPRAVRGRVTVAGTFPVTLPASISVLAAYEGKGHGRLGGLLSVQTTAQEDGSFELAGLTPGRYSIQAALDNIWLSPSAIVDVKDASANDLTLAIPAPGGPVVVKVFAADGKPAIGRTITIDRPSGRLATMLWPGDWTTDGAGQVYVPALETGKHTLRLKGTTVSVDVVVPALPAERPVEVQMKEQRNDP